MPKLHNLNADRITAVILLAFGAAVTYGGWVMDRLEIRRIHPASIPGLLPILLGIALMICAVVLYVQTRDKAEAGTNLSSAVPMRMGRLALILAVTLAYALGLVGTLPFWAATFVFVAGFICVFDWPADVNPRSLSRLALAATIEGVAVAVAVSLLFEKAFLVRLP